MDTHNGCGVFARASINNRRIDYPCAVPIKQIGSTHGDNLPRWKPGHILQLPYLGCPADLLTPEPAGLPNRYPNHFALGIVPTADVEPSTWASPEHDDHPGGKSRISAI